MLGRNCFGVRGFFNAFSSPVICCAFVSFGRGIYFFFRSLR
jgi:hypothetical protein